MSDSPHNLTRQALAAFIKDPRTLRAFEQMVSNVVNNTTIINNITDDPATGNAQAQLAADLVGSLGDDVGIELSTVYGLLASIEARLSVAADKAEFLALAPTKPEPKDMRQGDFYDTTTQTAAAINTAYAITYNTTNFSNGVYLGSPSSRIYVDSSGYFTVTFSLQISKASASTGNLFFWCRVNGVDQSNSASQITLRGSSAAQMATDHFNLVLSAGDYVELMFSVDDVDCQLTATAASAPVPAIPSVVISVSQHD